MELYRYRSGVCGLHENIIKVPAKDGRQPINRPAPPPSPPSPTRKTLDNNGVLQLKLRREANGNHKVSWSTEIASCGLKGGTLWP